MRIIYGKTNWECKELALEDYLDRVVADGFDAAELYIPLLEIPPAEVKALVESRGLQFIGDVATKGDSPQEHLESFNRYADYALEAGSILINSHTSRDFFSFEDTARIFERGIELAHDSGIPVAHETHRSRALYSAIDTRRYLEALPELRINADFSHWFNVHETDLRDQQDTLDLAVSRAIHIHARVGHEQGPQVNDPRAPEWSEHVGRHLELWQAIVSARQAEGADFLTITPEFGPAPYMPAAPHSQEPLADCWEVNVHMRDLLRRELNVG